MTVPHSLEAEREILAAVLVDPMALDDIVGTVDAADFYVERHQILFEAMVDLWDRREGIDPVTLAERVKSLGKWERLGGARTIGEILDRSGAVANVRQYARILRDKGTLRRLQAVGGAIAVRAGEDVDDVQAFHEDAERQILEVREVHGGDLRWITGAVSRAVEGFCSAVEEGGITGVRTGLENFDKLSHGLQPGELTILAARPSMGKTALALNWAAHAAARDARTVAVFSLEMPEEALASRLIASEARLDLARLRSGKIAADEWPRLNEAADRVAGLRIKVDDTPALTPAALRAKCRRLQRREGLDLVIVDYLQLMAGGVRTGSREQEISHISRNLKVLAKDLRCPVVALSQLNRGLEARADKRPMMSDLRESGAIEQDADLICFLYRDHVYNAQAPADAAELIVAKNRQGPPGMVPLRYVPGHVRFEGLA